MKNLLEKIDMLISNPERMDEYTGTSKRYGDPDRDIAKFRGKKEK
jgi:hypothetical protein